MIINGYLVPYLNLNFKTNPSHFHGTLHSIGIPLPRVDGSLRRYFSHGAPKAIPRTASAYLFPTSPSQKQLDCFEGKQSGNVESYVPAACLNQLCSIVHLRPPIFRSDPATPQAASLTCPRSQPLATLQSLRGAKSWQMRWQIQASIALHRQA